MASDIITAGALHAACSAGDVTLVSELIARHQLLDIDSLDSDGNTALCIAAKHGHANVVTLLSKVDIVDLIFLQMNTFTGRCKHEPHRT